MLKLTLFIYLLCLISVESNALISRERQIRPPIRQCDLPLLRNGIVRLRQRGKLVRFQCTKGFTLIGSIYAGCVGGKWDASIPMCAKSGCPKMLPPDNGYIIEERKGAMVSFFCKDNYQAAGSRTAYCDGKKWDRALGSCRETDTGPPLWCDFEVDNLCDWIHDTTQDFEWKLILATDNSRKARTGPLYDHTMMKTNQGHYMLLESINQFPDERARLISPVYPAHLSGGACFRLFYYMYGATVGTLRVYVKPVSIDLETVLVENRYLFFELSGNQKNQWNRAVFEIDKYDENFQIIIEGTAGPTHLSDIAIDDVALLNESECINETFANYQSLEFPGVIDIQSCNGRCNEEYDPNIVPFKIIQNEAGYFIKTCSCHSRCEDNNSCCPTYRSICAFGQETTDISITEPNTLFPENESKISSYISTSTKAISSTSTKTTTSTSTKSSVSTTETSKVTTESLIVPNISVDFDNTESYLENKTRTYYFYEDGFNIATEGQDIFRYDIPKTTTKLYNNQDFTWEPQSESFPSDLETSPSTFILFIISTFLSIIGLLIFSIGLRYYRYHFGPENYKKNSEKICQNAIEEFSEVHYLTCNEQLNFTLQIPENNDSDGSDK